MLLLRQIQLKVTCVTGAMAHLPKWRVMRWSSSPGSRSGMKACTAAGRRFITTRPPSTFKWNSPARNSSSVSTDHVVFVHLQSERLVYSVHSDRINMLRNAFHYEVCCDLKKKYIRGFNNCVRVCVLALAVVVGLSSALAGTLVLVLTSWVCW